MEIYILIDDKPQGPYPPKVVRQYLATGRLKPTDLAAYPGRSDWKPLSTIVQSWDQAEKLARSSPAAAPSANSSKRKSLIVMAVAVVAVLVVGAGFIFWKSRAKASWSAMNVVTPADRSWPNSFAELNEWYVEPSEGQNAATFYLKGLNALQITDADLKSPSLPVIGRGLLPSPGTPLAPGTKASIADVLQRNDEALAALKQGTSFEQARYPIDLNLGPDTLLPHLGKIKKAVQLEQLKAVLCAEDNQSEAATDTLLVSLAVAQSVKDEPILISQLVRVACFAIDAASLQSVVNSTALSSADLERLSTAFGKAESAEIAGQGFTRALVGERVGLTFFDLPPDKLEDLLRKIGFNDSKGSAPKGMTHDLPAQRAFAEETFNHALAMRKEPFPERLKVDEYFASRASMAKNKRLNLCAMLLGALGKVTRREAAGLANLRLAQAAIALEKFRQTNAGSYPDSLAALTPKFLSEVPVDPFNGDRMHYQKTGAGYELQSTGQDPAKPLSIKVVTPPKLGLI